jgi:flagellar assembly protein FliH
MAATTDEGKLSAWERWELASFDPQQPTAPAVPEAAAVAPAVTGPSPEELDAIRRQARDEGYQAGYQQGQAAAREEAQRLGQAADQLQRSLAEMDQQVADQLLALAMEIGRQVVRRELAAQPEAILDVVREALVQLPHQHAVIYLHPEDASLVRSYLGDSLTHSGHRILEEPRLARGGCLLESGGSQLDATVATRWRRIVENLGLDTVWDKDDAP